MIKRWIMKDIFEFLRQTLNTIRYNGVYIFLSIAFPLILIVLDAGIEIMRSLSEVQSQLNLSLCLVAFFILGFSVWCIPTLAITMFRFFTGYKEASGISQPAENENQTPEDETCVKKINPQDMKSEEELFASLVAIYNDKPTDNDQKGKTQFPIRYFAVFPWLMFLLTYYRVVGNSKGLALEVIVIIVLFVIGNCFYKKYKKNIPVPEKPLAFLLKCTIPFLVLLTTPYFLGISAIHKYHLYTYGFIAPLSIVIFYYTLCLLEYKKTNYQLSKFNYDILLIVLIFAIVGFYILNVNQLLSNISPVVILIVIATIMIMIFDLFIGQYLLAKFFRIKIAETLKGETECEKRKYDIPILKIQVYQLVILTFPIVVILLTLFSSLNSHKIRKISEPGNYVSITDRTTLIDYFEAWYKNIDSVTAKDSTIYLISGQGGGSRAAAWFFMNMINLEKQAKDTNFYRKVFSISTVSGSSVGAYMYLGTKYFDIDAAYIDSAAFSGLFAKNYMSSAFYGLFLGDGIDGMLNKIIPSDDAFPKDRNYYLQKEEMDAFNKTFHEKIDKRGKDFFEADYMHMYQNIAKIPPLFLINTAIIDKGTRGVFSPVQLEGVSLARDLYKEFKIEDHNGQYNIPLTTCVNQSQAFPLLSAYNYMDRVGRFIDGGLYENTGCATTLEVYEALRKYLDTAHRGIKIVLYSLTSGNMTDDYTVSYKNASILNSLTALMKVPFGGHQNFAYNDLKRQVTYLNRFCDSTRRRDTVINIPLNDEITLTRCLSNSSVGRMRSLLPKEFYGSK